MSFLVRLISHWPFTAVGLVTFVLFIAAPFMGLAENPVVLLLIMPLWLMRTLEMFTGIGLLPWPLQLVTALPLLFLPYVAIDLLNQWLRRRIKTRSRKAI